MAAPLVWQVPIAESVAPPPFSAVLGRIEAELSLEHCFPGCGCRARILENIKELITENGSEVLATLRRHKACSPRRLPATAQSPAKKLTVYLRASSAESASKAVGKCILVR